MADLADLGWSEFFARQFDPGEGLSPARVVAEHRTIFRVAGEAGEFNAAVSGRLRHEADSRADLPAVGDWVLVERPVVGSTAAIHRVLERKSKFSRKAAGDRADEQIVAANVDVVWIVTALDQDFSLRRIERYLALALTSGAAPAVVLNKSDLCEDVNARRLQVEAIASGAPVHATNAITGAGLDDLLSDLANHATVALLGSSGVGKSTLVNRLAGMEVQRTSAIRETDGKGRHTTTYRQLIRLPDGGLIVDAPGMRELQLWDAEEGVQDTFGDIEQLAGKCRFSDCRHEGEPGCAVTAAVQRGELAADRVASYQKLNWELDYLERKQDARAQLEEKRRARVIAKSVRKHPKYDR